MQVILIRGLAAFCLLALLILPLIDPMLGDHTGPVGVGIWLCLIVITTYNVGVRR